MSRYGLLLTYLAMTMIREVLYTTGITATAGIGTNLYLSKVAMDIVAKHVPADVCTFTRLVPAPIVPHRPPVRKARLQKNKDN